MGVRINKVLNELNIGLQTAIDFLKQRRELGEVRDDMTPSTKISDEQYEALVYKFRVDKNVKEKSEKLFKNINSRVNQSDETKQNVKEDKPSEGINVGSHSKISSSLDIAFSILGIITPILLFFIKLSSVKSIFFAKVWTVKFNLIISFSFKALLNITKSISSIINPRSIWLRVEEYSLIKQSKVTSDKFIFLYNWSMSKDFKNIIRFLFFNLNDMKKSSEVFIISGIIKE